MINTPLPGIDDPEGAGIPASSPPVIDAHVHLFPDVLFEAIWQWFDQVRVAYSPSIEITSDCGFFIIPGGISHRGPSLCPQTGNCALSELAHG